MTKENSGGTLGFKSKLGFGSGKTTEEKRGEVAIAMLKALDGQWKNCSSAVGKSIIQRIMYHLMFFVMEEKDNNNISIPESEENNIRRTLGHSTKPSFVEQEKHNSYNIGSVMRDLRSSVEEDFRGNNIKSSVKVNYFDNAFLALSHSIRNSIGEESKKDHYVREVERLAVKPRENDFNSKEMEVILEGALDVLGRRLDKAETEIKYKAAINDLENRLKELPPVPRNNPNNPFSLPEAPTHEISTSKGGGRN